MTPREAMAKLAIADRRMPVPNVSITEDQRRFIDASVASGRFANASEVMRHALRLMQDAEDRRAAFVRMLEDVAATADRDGTLAPDTVDAEMQAAIADATRQA